MSARCYPLAQRDALEQAGNFRRMPRLKGACALFIAHSRKGSADKGYDVSLFHVSPQVAHALPEQAEQAQPRLGARRGRSAPYLPTSVNSALSPRGSELMKW